MKRRSRRIALMVALAFPVAMLPRAARAATTVQEAVAALRHQDYKSAEQILRTEVKLHPDEAEALSLLGVALDEQNRLPEAAEFHRRAVANSPRSTAALYNYANHLLAAGDEKTAREMLLRSIALDPADRNANLALAQLALNLKDGREALVYLDRLKGAPGTEILRLTALDLAGSREEAGALFEQLAAAAQNDPKMSAEVGWALAKAGQFEQAEIFLTHALAADPGDFQMLYGVGVTASQAGHNEKARGVLEAALRQQPGNVDVLYALAVVYNAQAQTEPAIRLLAEAGKLAPQRADVQKLLAITARNMKADEDSVAAWDRYLKLVPNDDEARRERAYGKARLALLDEALPELQWFAAKHPEDATGFYELGMAESVDDPAKAISSLDHAIGLKPDMVAARAMRGILLYTQNKPEAALADLEFALGQVRPDAPERGALLDRLGQTYVALNRLPDAIPALRKAAELTPGDSTTVLHLANALAEAGQTDESDALMAHFREMRPGGRAPKVSGVVDYLGTTPAARHDLYRARLEKAVHDHPDDVNTQMLFLKALLSDRQMAEAAAAARRLAAMKPGAAALAEAAHALLEAQQYTEAKELLGLAAAADPSSAVKLDSAVATFRAGGADAAAGGEGLRELDRIPEAGRNSGYYLAQAEMFDSEGKPGDSISAMKQAIRRAPEDPDLYWQTAAFMVKDHRSDDALRLLEQAAIALPQEAQIPIMRAAVLELAGDTGEARHVLDEAQHHWPEAPAVWVAQGIILTAHGQAEGARKSLETAVSLGARSPETFYALAESTFQAGTEHRDAAEAAIQRTLAIEPDNERAKALLARIAAGKRGDASAPESRDEAPDMAGLFLSRPPREW